VHTPKVMAMLWRCAAVCVACADSSAEKVTRAAFKAEVDRRLSRSAVVVLDSLNNIKGFRCVSGVDCQPIASGVAAATQICKGAWKHMLCGPR